MSYIRFYSEADFNISIYNYNSQTWDGDLLFSADGGSTWTTWGQNMPTAWSWANTTQGTYEIWFRGENTTLTSRNSTANPAPVFVISRGSNVTPQNAPVYCEGNIESLFDYTMVDNNQHPTVTNYCCAFLFYQQTLLASAPDIGFVSVPDNGCISMFAGCSGLINPPALPATTLNEGCYAYMFADCTSLTTVPQLPATSLANTCYMGMFSGSGVRISDTQHGAYNIPFIIAAEDNAFYARSDMFAGCGVATPDVNTTYYILNQNQTYTTTASEIISIADAIRTKGGTSAALTYPNGFISAINDIQAGGDADVEDGIITRTISGVYENSRVTEVGHYAFAYCSSLTTASFPNATTIDSCAFLACSNLTTISFPSVTTIRSSAFAFCSSLTTASFPNASRIGSFAFYNCAGLTNITASDFPSVASIYDSAFYGCTQLSEVSFSSVQLIGSYAFQYCNRLTTASFPSAKTISTGAFLNCTTLPSADFPSVTGIGTSAFASCFNLANVSFPKLKSIYSYAFQYCRGLTTVSFPKVTTISNYAFRYCYNLISLYLSGTSVVTLGGTATFTSTPIGGYSTSAGQYGSVYVPSSLLTSYKAATYWSTISARIVGY